MRKFIVPVAAAILMTSTPAPAAETSDEKAVKAIFEAFQMSWNTPGMPGFDQFFTIDADFVVITGKWLRGRDEIVSYHRDLLASFYAGSHLSFDRITVRIVDRKNAIAHIVSGADFAADGKKARRTALATATLRKADGGWKIQTFHNTLTGGPGYSFTRPASRPD